MHKEIMDNLFHLIKEIYKNNDVIPLHAPVFKGKEKEYLADCIDSTFVSYVGQYVKDFEKKICTFTRSTHAISIVNGTTALFIALLAVGVRSDDLILTTPLTFIATINAISHIGASPVFIDVNKNNLIISPDNISQFLEKNCEIQNDGFCYHRKSKQRISACVPVYIFGHASKIEEIINICKKWNIKVVEDAAESLGSFYKGKHTGTFGDIGIFSFNGNKIITTGGGGMIITDNEEYARRCKHLTTTAKIAHPWEFIHDEIGYNFRMPNINAAVGCAQIEMLPRYLECKRELASQYESFCRLNGIAFIKEPENCISNYWLNTIALDDRSERDNFLTCSHQQKILCRPIWKLINTLDMYKDCIQYNLKHAYWFEDRIVNLPSSIHL